MASRDLRDELAGARHRQGGIDAKRLQRVLRNGGHLRELQNCRRRARVRGHAVRRAHRRGAPYVKNVVYKGARKQRKPPKEGDDTVILRDVRGDKAKPAHAQTPRHYARNTKAAHDEARAAVG